VTAVNAITASGNFSDGNVHAIRKNLKDIFYTLKIYQVPGKDIAPQNIFKVKNEKYFIRLLEELGNYQDRCISIALLKLNGLNSLNSNNPRQLEQIKKIWLKDKASIKKILVHQLKKINAPKKKPINKLH
jgi:hypothetical protein